VTTSVTLITFCSVRKFCSEYEVAIQLMRGICKTSG